MSRYHWEIVQQKEYLQTLKSQKRKRYARDHEFRKNESSVIKLISALNLIRIRIYDASHSEWKKLERIIQKLLFSFILTKRDDLLYLKVFQNFQYSSHWFRIQFSAFYIWSWSLFESKRATVLTSLILRAHAQIEWFRLSYLQAVDRIFTIETSAMQAIIKTFDIIVKFNTLIKSQVYTDSMKFH